MKVGASAEDGCVDARDEAATGKRHSSEAQRGGMIDSTFSPVCIYSRYAY